MSFLEIKASGRTTAIGETNVHAEFTRHSVDGDWRGPRMQRNPNNMVLQRRQPGIGVPPPKKMDAQMRFVAFVVTLFVFLKATLSQYVEEETLFWHCRQNYNCGTLKEISYPFWGRNRPHYCGRDGFELKCRDNQTTIIESGSERFRVIEINQTAYTMRIVPEDLVNNHCEFKNTSLNANLFHCLPSVQNVTIFFDCNAGFSIGRNNFSCPAWSNVPAFYVNETQLQQFPDLQKQCRGRSHVLALARIPLAPEGGIDALKKALEQGFDVRYSIDWDDCKACTESGGMCGVGVDKPSQFSCHCWDRTSQLSACSNSKQGLKAIQVIFVVVGTSIIVAVLMRICFCIYGQPLSCRDVSLIPSQKRSINVGVQIFTHNELKAATSNFDSNLELGHGGFGAVYFGKLNDGRPVAIKRLYQNKDKRVKQFLNEVEILSRLRHQNLVSLYGCTSQHSHELLLVYEYIPNGTIADHLHGPKSKPGTLTWPIRLNIATEIASALVYLHASDIIHRDIKVSNILLDENFRVKVADFGLSRLFPENVSHVSTDPKGTLGYLDPEYHRSCQLTEKSDVYSFGVVLLELISSMPAVDTGRLDDEIKLANMATKKIQIQALHELVDPRLGFKSDSEIRETITAVAALAFQCVQVERDFRPSMADVWEALESIRKR